MPAESGTRPVRNVQLVDREKIREQLKGTQVEAALAVESSAQQTRGAALRRDRADARRLQSSAVGVARQEGGRGGARAVDRRSERHTSEAGHTESVVAFLRAVLDERSDDLYVR
jgi:hypothetical protein